MSDLTLTKTQLRNGIWAGILTGTSDSDPVLALRHEGEILSGVEVARTGDGQWAVQVAVPMDRISDDVQSFVIIDEARDAILASFAVFAGERIDEDLRAELDLLRAELDLLKRAFRRHCIETS